MVRVALTYIVTDNKDYPKFEKSLQTFMPYFHGLYVVLNGLSGEHDKIIKLVKKYKGEYKVINEKTHPDVYNTDENGLYFQRFDLARQVSFDMVPADKYDYISWADYDDILLGGNEIQHVLTRAKENKLDAITCTYYYSNVFNDKGELVENLIPHERERFIKPGVAYWKSDLHEVMIPYGEFRVDNYKYNPKENRNLLWLHTSKNINSPAGTLRNFRILKTQAKRENEQDPRTLFALAKVYVDLANPEHYDEALRLLNKYLMMSGWADERADACDYASKLYILQGKYDDAITTLHMALKEKINSHIPYLKLAELYFYKNDLEKANHCITVYENMKPMESEGTISNIGEAKLLYVTVKFQQAHRMGKLEEAVKWATEREEFLKRVDPDYKSDKVLEEVTEMRDNEKVAEGFLNVATKLIKDKNYKELESLIEATPLFLQKENVMKDVVRALPPKKFSDKSIVYLASFYSKHFEEWNGDSVKKGIGGSESAVIYLAEEWVKKGYEVFVYCDTPEDCVINGVHYIKYWKFNFLDEFNILIFWRTPFHLPKRPNAKKLFVDVHDVLFQGVWTDKFMGQIDKIFFKSKAHRDQLPKLPDDKAVVISNGIKL